MNFENLAFRDNDTLTETEYSLANEPVVAALFTTGNGYIGVRGSLEEYGSVRIQGAYIRGLIDRIYELPQPFTDNLYMKKYYINEDALKHFEKQDSIINFADFLLVRVSVGGETFYPWEGNLISWERSLDLRNSKLNRSVVWENSKGQITKIEFERFSSFADDHLYCMQVKITPQNHDAEISVMSGIDTRTKTNGQRIAKKLSSEVFDDGLNYHTLCGEAFGFEIYTSVVNRIDAGVCGRGCLDDELIANIYTYPSRQNETVTLEKFIYTVTSRDHENFKAIAQEKAKQARTASYDQLYAQHQKEWNRFFECLDIVVEGDDNLDAALRFSNYHTAISLARNDSVHSLSAKGLTGEIYNNFVWWDCEVYQMPVFLHTTPEYVKNCILYRYRLLDAARENAKKEGRRGARFPFTSSVTGEETVWEYARHPFMQIHIVSDVGLSCVQYYLYTGDKEFFLRYGLEILLETARYFAHRVEFNAEKNRYEINTVTGTDEHHPYVDNNAYTNYCVWLLLTYALRFFKEFQTQASELYDRIGLTPDEIQTWQEIVRLLYLPYDTVTDMIPQFDGYFELSRDLEIEGGSAAKSFQMKHSGLYHKSQVIKQPDVLLLFSHFNFPFGPRAYRRNWNYYENRCESSSSLSYCVHAICAADMDEPDSAYRYLQKTACLDLNDEHDCAHQGIHAACAAGAWLSVVRGIAGIRLWENGVEVTPHMIPWLKSIRFRFVWHGQRISVTLNNEIMTFYSDEQNTQPVDLYFEGADYLLDIGQTLCLSLGTKVKADGGKKGFHPFEQVGL